MIDEVEQLLSNGDITYNRLNTLGLEYRFIGMLLNGELNKEAMLKKLNTAIHQFSKKQMTFFRNMERNGIKINWISNGDIEEVIKLLSI